MKTLFFACLASLFLWACGSNTRDRNEIKKDTVASPGNADGDTSIRDTASYERMPQKMNDSTKK